jgi:hypothetical protein
MKKYIIFFVFLLAIGISIFLFLLNTEKKSESEMLFLKDKELSLKQRIHEMYSIEMDKLDLNNIYCYRDSIFPSLETRLSESTQLVMFIPERNCTDCILEEYNRLKQLPENIQDKIILLTNFDRNRDVKLWKNEYHVDYPIYNNKGFFLKNFEKLGHISFFMVDSTLILQHFFIPISFIPELSKEYYTFITSQFESGSSTESNEYSSEMILDKKKHDFGIIKKSEEVSTVFEIQNNSEIPLYISEIKTSCGCTVAELDKKTIKKDEKVNLKVNFKAEDIGHFSKKITIHSNAIGILIQYSSVVK